MRVVSCTALRTSFTAGRNLGSRYARRLSQLFQQTDPEKNILQTPLLWLAPAYAPNSIARSVSYSGPSLVSVLSVSRIAST